MNSIGTVIGILSVGSFIHTNNKLQEKYYCLMASAKNKWKINKLDILSLNYKGCRFPLYTELSKYTKLQKIHYLGSLIMVVFGHAIAINFYLDNKTKLHFEHSQLIYFPIDVPWCLFMNSTFFYFYHRLVHTKYLYKYIHSYHHAFRSPELYDSLIGHPLDHTCSAILQILPMFIYKMHLFSFLTYSSILSLMGIYDHSGIKLYFSYYTTLTHHIHHKYPNKNFGSGFPLLVWDKLFNTYQEHL
jgi:sterol desaturase/sphingolipid hydroxylase (fatty acid hydroxylase superfamily)